MNGTGPERIEGDRWRFSVWARACKSMTLHIVDPRDEKYKMKKNDEGLFVVECDNIKAGTGYFFQGDDGKDLPDPASRFQPKGVHGPSAVVDHSQFKWTDQLWRGKPLEQLIIYELHVGTFSEAGTFEGMIPHLDHLIELGVNAIEIMPVAQFPGERNWGYDGVFPYAVQHSYGGPAGMKKLVDACHQKGIAVILDVVYNHMGPEGNYFTHFGPYFSKAHHVPWGDAVNFDQQHSDPVREYFINNITHWLEHYHIDGLRLDAIHTIHDSNPVHILREFNEQAERLRDKLGKPLFLIGESDLNDPKVINAPAVGGYGFKAQWLDDFHHALTVLVDPNDKKRYADFGHIHQLAKAFSDGFVHSGEYVKFRKRKYGASSAGIDGSHFVVFVQNHDQVGNRVIGERQSTLVGIEQQMVLAAALILSPYIPMLFMGEEYSEDAPFMYFVDHSDPELIKAVREGRKKEFAEFGEDVEPKDAEDKKTFEECKLRWNTRDKDHHGKLFNWYKDLITLRKTNPVFQQFDKSNIRVSVIGPAAMAMYRYTSHHSHEVYVLFNFGNEEVYYTLDGDNWNAELSSAPTDEEIPGNTVKIYPMSVSVYTKGSSPE